MAASRLNLILVPCDVPSFTEYYSRNRTCFPSVTVAAFGKEPASLEMLESVARSTGMNLLDAKQFRECWIKVIGRIVDGEVQPPVELRQLTRNGAGRVSGLGPTLSAVGILTLSPAASKKKAPVDVRLGITRRGYNVVHEEESFIKFWELFDHDGWAIAINEPCFIAFCRSVRSMLEEIAQRTSVLGLAAEGYCFHFLYRKLLIGEARFRKRSTSFAAVDWLALTVGDLKYMSTDENEHLDSFETHTSAGALSHFFSVELIGLSS